MKLYFCVSCLWKVLPILGNSKLSGISLSLNLFLILFLKVISSSSILGLIYLSSSDGQNPQKALQMMLPNLVFCSTPNMSFLSFWRMSYLCSKAIFSFYFFIFCKLFLFTWALCWGSSRIYLLPPLFDGGSIDLFAVDAWGIIFFEGYASLSTL